MKGIIVMGEIYHAPFGQGRDTDGLVTDEEATARLRHPTSGAMVGPLDAGSQTPEGDSYAQALDQDPDGSRAGWLEQQAASEYTRNPNYRNSVRQALIVAASILTAACLALNLGGARDELTSFFFKDEPAIEQDGQCWVGGQNLGPVPISGYEGR